MTESVPKIGWSAAKGCAKDLLVSVISVSAMTRRIVVVDMLDLSARVLNGGRALRVMRKRMSNSYGNFRISLILTL